MLLGPCPRCGDISGQRILEIEQQTVKGRVIREAGDKPHKFHEIMASSKTFEGRKYFVQRVEGGLQVSDVFVLGSV